MELCEIWGSVRRETEKAILFKPRCADRDFWIARSQIGKIEFHMNGYDKVFMSAWIAKKLRLR